MIKTGITLLLFALIVFTAPPSNAAIQQVSFPITLDYPLLRSLLIQKGFPEEDEKTTLVNQYNGCILLSAAQPQIEENNGLLRLELLINAHAGTPLGGNCYTPAGWQGYLILDQKPYIDPETWQLSFTPVSAAVLSQNRQPAKIATILWNMIEQQVTTYLADLKIDLMPPVADIKGFLLPLFPMERQEQTQRMLASMQPGSIQVGPDSIEIPISAEVESVFEPQQSEYIQQLSQEELQHLVATWEKWDGLLVVMVTTLTRQMLSDEEKRALINVLLDTRYKFVTELSERTIKQDIVRQQFVAAWQVMAPIFRRHLLQKDQISQAIGYLAFVSAADALLVFDSLGPSLGMEISTAGLTRLLHMLNADPALLEYHQGVNEELQKLFEVEPQNEQLPSPAQVPEATMNSSSIHWLISPFMISQAHAASTQPPFSEILKWKVPKSDVAEYVSKVGKLLDTSTTSLIDKKKVPENKQNFFRLLIPAMAWQESCFRQFVVKKKKLTYLLSYNNSSVGLMQVNERVWRGLYNLNRLRWDIHYNAEAGGEIAALYLKKYALRDADKAQSLDDDTLARLVYALYNGGPSQYKKFFQRKEKNSFYDSDKLFWEKYLHVKSGEIEKVSVCLVGR